MQKRIGFLVTTDGICVVPICIIAFLSYAGFNIPKDTYIVTTCFLLPINSALNPLIYSKVGNKALGTVLRWIKSIYQWIRKAFETNVDPCESNVENDAVEMKTT